MSKQRQTHFGASFFFHSQSPQLQIQTYTHPHACHKYRWVGECVHEWVTTEFHAGFLEQICDPSYVVCIVLNTVYPDAGVHRESGKLADQVLRMRMKIT